MLELRNIYAAYTEGDNILKGINLTINDSEVVGVIGQNGSGKTTLAKTIMNLVPYFSGEIIFDSKPLNGMTPDIIANKGIGFFLQGGRIFSHLTVKENLEFAARKFEKKTLKKRIVELREYFDVIKNGREKLQASYLSGGEQHQLALAMVLMQKPKFLILDEPSAGLSPTNVKSLYNALFNIKENEVKNILIIEQNVAAAIEFSDRVLLLSEGKIVKEEFSKKLNSAEKIDEFFFGNFN